MGLTFYCLGGLLGVHLGGLVLSGRGLLGGCGSSWSWSSLGLRLWARLWARLSGSRLGGSRTRVGVESRPRRGLVPSPIPLHVSRSPPPPPLHGTAPPPHVPRPNNTKIFNLNNRDYYLMRLPTSWIVRNVMFFFVCASHGGNSVTPIVGMIPLGNQIF